MKDTFYMYLNIENEFIKQKNAQDELLFREDEKVNL